MTSRHVAYKTEIDPTDAQARHLSRHCGCARFAYNWALAKKKEHYEATGETLPYRVVDSQFNAAKNGELSWAKLVSKHSHQNAIRNLESAFSNFFRRLKSGGKPGYPNFKKKHQSQPSYQLSGDGYSVSSERIRLAKIGWVKLKRKGYIPTGNVKFNSATISHRAGRWFVSVQVEEEVTVTENQSGNKIGLDLGLKSFVVDSNGKEVSHPKWLEKSLGKIRKASRIHSRRQSGSNKKRKAACRLAKINYKISCQRSDFLNKLSRRYVAENSAIAIEGLSVAEMVKNRRLSRLIGDSGWGEFRRQLEYKSEWHGSKLVIADRFFASSKTCSCCGAKKESLSLSERVFNCEECGFSCGRDHNAALNLVGLVKAEPSEKSENARGELAIAGSAIRELTH